MRGGSPVTRNAPSLDGQSRQSSGDVAPQGRLDLPVGAPFLYGFGGHPEVNSQEYNSGLFISKGIFVGKLCKQGKMA